MSRMLALRAVLLVIAFAMGGVAHAATAYKCIDARGAISFQDQPCRTGQKQHSIRLPDSAPPAETTAEAPPPPPAALPPPQPVPPTPAPPPTPQIPVPAFYLCTRADGSTYMSEDGQGSSMAVPLGIMGIPNRSLADAYSGPNSIGVSAPGLRKIPNVPAGAVPFGGMYTWIYDECHFAQPREACSYLRTQLDDVGVKLRRAFSDEAPQLEQQQATLRERMRGC
jgi:hypothetical protein